MKARCHLHIIAAVLFFTTICIGTGTAEEKKKALFPEENNNILFIEGEEAVSTNFAVEPTLYYGTSGSRTLQLNRTVGLQGGAPFFAEYVFYLEEAGTFRFWYGGTPPGPKDDLLPSYTSPFTYSIDGGQPIAVYRENITIREGYVPSYYWNDVGTIELDAGIHRLRFEVHEKRRYDGKYYFYLDNFFLVRERALSNPGIPIPEVFPESLVAERDIEFLTISSYEKKLVETPDDMGVYSELALVYTLLGEYLNALKILQRAQLIDPENTYYMQLAAKNRIWKGDTPQGLSLFKEILKRRPERVDLWAEAGKIAAWTGSYQESIFFYSEGLKQHPGNLDLTVNLGITHLWRAEEDQAARYFDQAYKIAEKQAARMSELAQIFFINGYPEKAVEVYTRAITSFPEHLGFYLELESLYTTLGRPAEADETMETIASTFSESEKLNRYIETFKIEQSLREQVIDAYQQQVARSPDNLGLRRMLVQTYFWNGRRAEAIQEYLSILGNYAYRDFVRLDTDNAELLKTLDVGHLYYTFFSRFSASVRDKLRELTALSNQYTRAEREYQRHVERQESGKAAEESSAETQEEESITPEEVLQEAGTALERYISREQLLLDTINSKLAGYDNDMAAIEPIKAESEKETARFEQVTESIQWQWERDFFIRELETIFRDEKVLSGHVLGKIYQYETRFQSAESIFTQISEQPSVQAATWASFAENYLWQGKWDRFSDLIEEQTEVVSQSIPYFAELTEKFKSFQTESVEETFFTPSLAMRGDAVALLEQRFEEIKERVDTLIPQVKADLDTLHRILLETMKQRFFQIESNTYLIRYELGEYFLEQNDLVRATEQFEKVLDIDPWNVDAKFNLGVVRQRYGDWNRAKKMFNEVYTYDPTYPNAATYYNQLARRHPDRFTFRSKLLGDPQMISLEGDVGFRLPISTVFSLTGRYEFNSTRLYTTYDGEKKTSYQIHTAKIGLPVDLYVINLTITPGVGVMFDSDLFADDGAYTQNDSLLIGDFLSSWNAYPIITGELALSLDYLTARGSYVFGTIEETFAPQREPVRRHIGDLSIAYSFAGLHLPALKDSSLRGYGALQFVEDDNIIATVLEEGIVGIHLLDSPWTSLTLMETVTFEHSLIPSHVKNNGYYAPDSILQAKGGVITSAWFSLPNQNALGASLTVTGGGYWQKVLQEQPDNPWFQLELVARFDFTKNKSNYYVSAFGSQTWDTVTGEPKYWSLSINVGVEASVMRLLSQ